MGAVLIIGPFFLLSLVPVAPAWEASFALFNAFSFVAGFLFLMAENVKLSPENLYGKN